MNDAVSGAREWGGCGAGPAAPAACAGLLGCKGWLCC